jgi:hypothetical protein
MNSGTVLSRSRFANAGAFVNQTQGAVPGQGLGRIEEILVPSIFRFGARFSF